jgi:hypothetical protein
MGEERAVAEEIQNSCSECKVGPHDIDGEPLRCVSIVTAVSPNSVFERTVVKLVDEIGLFQSFWNWKHTSCAQTYM